MKNEVFYGKGMNILKDEDPDLYSAIVKWNDEIWSPKVLDFKTQKLIAVAIAASGNYEGSVKKQILSAKKEANVSRDEILDVLKIVLLTSGMPAFSKALRILDEIY